MVLLAVAAGWWLGASLVIAATDTSQDPNWINYLLNGGPFAIVVLLLILDKLTTPGERDRLRAENAQLTTEVKTLNENIRNEIVPPLIEMNRLSSELVTLLSDDERFPKQRRRT